MTQTPTRPIGTGARVRAGGNGGRPVRKRGEGQWALGYREPLNPNEQSKKDDNPLNVRARIENIYARNGFASIDPGDLRGRFRWYGLYTQRKPGIDGGKTATLEPHELDDEFFMLRIRIDGGALTTEQLRVIGGISTEFARDTADVTDRRTSSCTGSGSRTFPRSGAGSRRSVCPPPRPAATVRGSSSARRWPASPRTRSSTRRGPSPTSSTATSATRSMRTCRGSSRPRSPATRPRTSCRDQRCRVRRSRPPEYGPGFDVWVGGGLSTNPMLASRLGAWFPRKKSPRCGPASPLSSVTTVTAGCVIARGSSSWWPTGVWRGSARCWRPSTSSGR